MDQVALTSSDKSMSMLLLSSSNNAHIWKSRRVTAAISGVWCLWTSDTYVKWHARGGTIV